MDVFCDLLFSCAAKGVCSELFVMLIKIYSVSFHVKISFKLSLVSES